MLYLYHSYTDQQVKLRGSTIGTRLNWIPSISKHHRINTLLRMKSCEICCLCAVADEDTVLMLNLRAHSDWIHGQIIWKAQSPGTTASRCLCNCPSTICSSTKWKERETDRYLGRVQCIRRHDDFFALQDHSFLAVWHYCTHSCTCLTQKNLMLPIGQSTQALNLAHNTIQTRRYGKSITLMVVLHRLMHPAMNVHGLFLQ